MTLHDQNSANEKTEITPNTGEISEDLTSEGSLSRTTTCAASSLSSMDREKSPVSSSSNIRRAFTHPDMSAAEYDARLKLFQDRLNERTNLLKSLRDICEPDTQGVAFGKVDIEKSHKRSSTEYIADKTNATWD